MLSVIAGSLVHIADIASAIVNAKEEDYAVPSR
jgi:hypothetical protein